MYTFVHHASQSINRLQNACLGVPTPAWASAAQRAAALSSYLGQGRINQTQTGVDIKIIIVWQEPVVLQILLSHWSYQWQIRTVCRWQETSKIPGLLKYLHWGQRQGEYFTCDMFTGSKCRCCLGQCSLHARCGNISAPTCLGFVIPLQGGSKHNMRYKWQGYLCNHWLSSV